jgi:site-specific recombinase XerD
MRGRKKSLMLIPPKDIPTVSEAVDCYIRDLKDSGKDWRSHASVLWGPPTGRVTGRAAAGTTLARSELGPQRFDRVGGDDFKRWFHQRHPTGPTGLAASTRKRGRSCLRSLIETAVSCGWATNETLKIVYEIEGKPSAARRAWLHPEQIAVLDTLMRGGRFEADEVMRWDTMLATGARVAELVTLRASCLEARDGVLIVKGKYAKVRRVPVSKDFQETWLAYVSSRRLKPDDWMFPLMGQRFRDGGGNERVVLDPKRHCDEKAVRAMLVQVQDMLIDKIADTNADGTLLPTFKVGPHALRRTYACMNLVMAAVLGPEHGLDLRSLQIAMGHESLETTALYLSDVDEFLTRHRRPTAITGSLGELLPKLDGMRQGSLRLVAVPLRTTASLGPTATVGMSVSVATGGWAERTRWVPMRG